MRHAGRTPITPVALAVALALSALLYGCAVGGPRGGVVLNSSGTCAAVLPLANRAVHGHGALVRIRRLRRAVGKPKRCMIVYRGPYRRGQLTRAPQAHGRFAIVLVRLRHPKVIRVRASDHAPALVAR